MNEGMKEERNEGGKRSRKRKKEVTKKSKEINQIPTLSQSSAVLFAHISHSNIHQRKSLPRLQ